MPKLLTSTDEATLRQIVDEQHRTDRGVIPGQVRLPPGQFHLARLKTDLTYENAETTDVSTAQAELVTQGTETEHEPYEDDDNKADILSVSGGGASIVIQGDHRSRLAIGTITAITGSTGNDGIWEIDSAPALQGSDTSLSFTENVPDLTADGELLLPAGHGLEDRGPVITVSGHIPNNASIGDLIVVGQYGREFIPLTSGFPVIRAYLKTTLNASTWDNGTNTFDALSTADAEVWHFDSAGDWVAVMEGTPPTEKVIEVTNLFLGIGPLGIGTLIFAYRQESRWIVFAADCVQTPVTLGS